MSSSAFRPYVSDDLIAGLSRTCVGRIADMFSRDRRVASAL